MPEGPDATTRALHDEIIKKVITIQNKLAEKLKASSDKHDYAEVRALVEIENTLSKKVKEDLGDAATAMKDKAILEQITKVLQLEGRLQASAEHELEELKKLEAHRAMQNAAENVSRALKPEVMEQDKKLEVPLADVALENLSLASWSTGFFN